MHRDRYSRAYSVFAELLEAPPCVREERLGQLASTDRELAMYVRRLLDADGLPTQGAWELPRELDLTPPMTAEAIRVSDDRSEPTIDGFNFIRCLARGGSSDVWQAEQQHPRRTVAVKVFRRTEATGSDLERFRYEADLLARLDHPGIARIFLSGRTVDGRPFLATELVVGVTLDRYLLDRASTLEQRVDLLRQVADAIGHAHTHLILHRDIKPANIIVAGGDGEPVARIVDFGIGKRLVAESLREDTVKGQLIGTPQYMSPEQAALDRPAHDLRIDVYGLGAVAFFIMTGTPPHPRLPSETLSGFLTRLQSHHPPRASAAAASNARSGSGSHAPVRTEELSGDLDAIIGKALSLDIDQRYATAGELLLDLERSERREPINARPRTLVYEASRFCQRHRGRLAGASALSFCIGLLVILAASNMIEARMTRAALEASRRQAIFGEAAAALDRGDPSAAKQIVMSIERPGFPARLLFAIADTSDAARRLTSDGLRDISAVSGPRGARVAIGNDSSVWKGVPADPGSWERLAVQPAALRSVAFDGDRRVLLGTWDAEIVCIDATDGTDRWAIDVRSELLAGPHFYPDRDTVVALDGDGVIWIDPADGRILHRHRIDGFRSEVSSEGGRTQAAFGDGYLVIAHGAHVAFVNLDSRSAAGSLTAADRVVELSIDGDVVAVQHVNGDLVTCDLENITSGWSPSRLPFSEGERLLLLADGLILTQLESGAVRLWESESRRSTSTFSGDDGRIQRAVVERTGNDGQIGVTTVGTDGVARWRRFSALQRPEIATRLVGDGILGAAQGEGVTQVFRGLNEFVGTLPLAFREIAAAVFVGGPAAGRLIVATDHGIARFDLAGDGTREEGWFRPAGSPFARATGISMLGDVVLIPRANDIEALHATDGRSMRTIPVRAAVSAWAQASDGNELLLGCFDGSLWSLDADSFVLRSVSDIGAIPLAIASRDEILAVGTNADSIVLFDDPDGTARSRTIPAGSSVTALSFDPSGRFLIAGTDDGVLMVVSLATGAAIYSTGLTDSPISTINFSSSEDTLLVGTAAGSLLDFRLR